MLYRRTKALFKESRQSLGSRQLMKKLRKHSHSVADNIVDQQFNPKQVNQIWPGDVTYLRTGQGWMYLAIVMDLYSRRIIGWSIHKRMTVDLVERAMQMALNLRKPTKG